MRPWLDFFAFVIVFGATAPQTALAGGAFFGFGGSAGDVDFDSNFAEDRVTSDDSVGGEWQVGYLFDSQLLVEGGGSLGLSIDTLSFGDSFSLTDYHVMVGYAFQPTGRLSIVPKIGVSHWRLESVESRALFFLPKQLADFLGSVESGNDWIFRVSAEWRIAQRLHLYGAYTEVHDDFGNWSAPSFGLKFQF